MSAPPRPPQPASIGVPVQTLDEALSRPPGETRVWSDDHASIVPLFRWR